MGLPGRDMAAFNRINLRGLLIFVFTSYTCAFLNQNTFPNTDQAAIGQCRVDSSIFIIATCPGLWVLFTKIVNVNAFGRFLQLLKLAGKWPFLISNMSQM